MNQNESDEDERDEAWLLARARGESAEHPDPARAASYERLEKALADLETPGPGGGWQAKVLAKIDEQEKAGAGEAADEPNGAKSGVTRKRPDGPGREPSSGPGDAGDAEVRELPQRSTQQRWRSLLPLIAAALAAATLLLLLLTGKPESRGEPIAYYFEGSNTRGEHRSDQAAVGDTLVLRARPEGEGEVRLYRDRRELVLRCPGGEGCERATERGQSLWRVKAPLKAPGRYRAIVMSGAPLPPPSGNEDQDLGAAVKVGAKVESASFTVR